MRTRFLIIAAFVGFAACQNQDNKAETAGILKDTATFTTIQWIDSVKNIGGVAAGDKAEIKFRFKNTGSSPLFVISAQPGCGCTVADYPKEAVAPGGEGIITAAFNAAKGSTGTFRKNISVTTNTKGNTGHTIFFYGEIREDGEKATSPQIDTAALQAIKEKELKKNLLLKPTKN